MHKLEHGFYRLSLLQQRLFFIKLIGLFLLFNLTVALLLIWLGLWALIPFVFAFSISVVAPFVDIPSGIKAGSLNYYSPLLIGEKEKDHCLVLHGGSLFDYYFVLDKTMTAKQRKKLVFVGYIEGLLSLIAQYEQQKNTSIKIKATSYILNARTANKVGLRPTKPDGIQRFILYFNFINLTCSLSLLNGKLTWPDMGKILSFEGELDHLITKKAELQTLRQRLGASS